MAIVTMVVITAYTATGRIVGHEVTRSAVVLGSGRVLGPLDELLRQGMNVEAQYPPTGPATITTGDDALVFSLPSLNATDALVPTSKDYVTVFRDTAITGNTRLIMTVYPDPSLPSTRTSGSTVLATNVESVYWRYPTVVPTDANVVTTTIRLTKNGRNQTAHQTVILNSTLRNH
jgi:hypothetical protein